MNNAWTCAQYSKNATREIHTLDRLISQCKKHSLWANWILFIHVCTNEVLSVNDKSGRLCLQNYSTINYIWLKSFIDSEWFLTIIVKLVQIVMMRVDTLTAKLQFQKILILIILWAIFLHNLWSLQYMYIHKIKLGKDK